MLNRITVLAAHLKLTQHCKWTVLQLNNDNNNKTPSWGMTPSLESFTHPVRLCMGGYSLLSIPSTLSGGNPGSDHWWRHFFLWILRTQSQSSLPQGRYPAVWTWLTLQRAFHQGSRQDQPRDTSGWGCCSWLILKTRRKLWLLQQTQTEKVEDGEKKKQQSWKISSPLSISRPLCPGSPSPHEVQWLIGYLVKTACRS